MSSLFSHILYTSYLFYLNAIYPFLGMIKTSNRVINISKNTSIFIQNLFKTLVSQRLPWHLSLLNQYIDNYKISPDMFMYISGLILCYIYAFLLHPKTFLILYHHILNGISGWFEILSWIKM